MTILTEGARTADFLVSESNGYRSRAEVVVDATGGALEAGTIMGIVTANGKYVRHDAAAVDGSETEAGILFEGIGAVEDNRTVIVRDAEVNEAHLTYEVGADQAQIDASNAALAGLGIVVR